CPTPAREAPWWGRCRLTVSRIFRRRPPGPRAPASVASGMLGVMGADDVLSFWFGEPGGDGNVDPGIQARWWNKDPAFDREIHERFGELHQRAAAGELDDWLDTARGRLAVLILLDQFSRNMFRDTPRMYAYDDHALRIAVEGIERGHDRELP